jgi:hypothetical protein
MLMFLGSGSTWMWANRVDPPEPMFGFGRVMAMKGNVLAVGRPEATGQAVDAFGAGQVFLYQMSGASPSVPMTLFAPDGAANDQFGSSVSLDASHVVVGAPGQFGGD